MPKSIRDNDIMDRNVLIGLNHKSAPVEIREKFASVCVDRTTPMLDQGIGMVVRYLADMYGQTRQGDLSCLRVTR